MTDTDTKPRCCDHGIIETPDGPFCFRWNGEIVRYRYCQECDAGAFARQDDENVRRDNRRDREFREALSRGKVLGLGD